MVAPLLHWPPWQREPPDGSPDSTPHSTVVRVRNSTGTRANRNIGIGTDTVVDADGETGLEAEGNVRLPGLDISEEEG